jgi:hypothetical protein
VKTVEATFDYAAEAGTNELSFRKGDRIVVIEDTEEGWWKGTNLLLLPLFCSCLMLFLQERKPMALWFFNFLACFRFV